ncbi:BTAD domain-containing putative transcriptional regulator [Lentzea guizhouensis]|uniref:BTAD domain-containing putative transcriptional regulator n=1 Tax=Lentzea guizhouensis TaxID=1586287 RepID=UPI0009F412AE
MNLESAAEGDLGVPAARAVRCRWAGCSTTRCGDALQGIESESFDALRESLHDERLAAQPMLALYRSGSDAEALRHYEGGGAVRVAGPHRRSIRRGSSRGRSRSARR